MPRIHLLSEDLINKIAAGEVIERPASVAKELIENALDAEATKITIELEDFGKKVITVTDNGSGMSQEDAQHCILRHATSKITGENDLYALSTLGFRGEALASIAAVSRLSITTKLHGEVEGYTLVVEGGRILHSTPVGAQPGTRVEVRNLFFNTPARKKFLKTDAVELRHIVDAVTRYALINPAVAFRLQHDGHELLNSPAVEDIRGNLAFMYGQQLAKELLEVRYEKEGIAISGFIAPPHHARNDKSQQSIFVNKRWVKNIEVINAVYDAYHSLLFVNKHPVVILNLEIDPLDVDVNIHPTKAEVKFGQREKVYAAVSAALRKTLQQNNLIPELSPAAEQLTLEKEPLPQIELPRKKFLNIQPGAKYPFEPGSQTLFEVKETSSYPLSKDPVADYTAGDYAPVEEEMNVGEVKVNVESAISRSASRFPPFRLLGQVHKTFFVAETLDGVFYVDQHAAHERVMYERFMQQYKVQQVEVQQLLRGELLEFSPTEKALLQEHYSLLEEMGFSMEHFGGNSYVVKSVPLLLGRLQPGEIVYEILSLFKDGRQKLLETKEEIVTRMACRAAVMAGDTLTSLEMQKILDELATTELPYTCPHGRPTMFKVTVDELEKKFRRK